MSFFSMIEALFIGPLKLIFEIIFQYSLKLVNHPGYAIIVLSLVMNILVLPLYRRADAMQEQARDVENKLRAGTEHIKKTFSGDERMMMLQTYNRQNNYKPTDVFKGSVSLLLEIPFFMAAYQFLSHLQTLEGVSFGPILDMSRPDALLTIGGVTLNLLPILMTTINVISSAIYLKGFPLKTKIQLYGMAAFFLVFLYTSPAGLVFYWTLNNIFSLVKNVFYKIKNPDKVLKVLTFVLGIAFIVLGFTDKFYFAVKPFLVLGILLLMPLTLSVFKRIFKTKKEKKEKEYTPSRASFFLGAVFLALFIGVFIPSTFIAASPQEYVDLTYFYDPIWYIVISAITSFGIFLVWFGVFYWLANKKGKVIMERLIWAACGIVLVNYMFFGTNLGVISPNLKYNGGMSFTAVEKLINLAVIIAVGLVLYFIITKWRKLTSMVLLTAIIALGVMSGIHVVTTVNSVDSIRVAEEQGTPHFELSKDGQNVVVMMLDRAMGSHIPYIFNEKPELAEKFDGFTYYDNVISYGGSTNIAIPALLGGYEYTPVELNKRDNELLMDKHNESLLVVPKIFADNGFKTTVCDPTYANYQWIPDLSLYDDYPEINAYITKGFFSNEEPKAQTVESAKRNFFCFGLMKSMPLFIQPALYNGGDYNQSMKVSEDIVIPEQVITGISTSTGMSSIFADVFNVLKALDNMTTVTNTSNNTYLFLSNDTTHEPAMLREPDYEPAAEVDNTAYDEENADRFILNGEKLQVNDSYAMIHYHANMAAMMKLGDWFDFLRENGVYDNTKIILVSDHSLWYSQLYSYIANSVDMNTYFPLLMVKDFGETGFKTSSEFMTTADVPTLCFEGTVENPVNPFTGKEINNSEKTAHPQFISRSQDWEVNVNNGTQLSASPWVSVDGSLKDSSKWEFYDNNAILTDHKFPKSHEIVK